MKRAVITLTVFVTVACLFGCSRKEVYSAEEMTIYRMETETEGKQFYVEMTVPPVQMSEETKEFLLSVNPVTDYTIQLSDGTHYGYHGMEGDDPFLYPHYFGSLDEMADSLCLDILTSDMAEYPESDKNFLAGYDTHSGTIRVMGVIPDIGKNYYILHREICLCFEPYVIRYSFYQITDEAEHEIYEIVGGEQAHLFYDLSKKKGTVLIRLDGAYYMWELAGIKTVDDLYEFADSLYWMKGS